MNIKKILSYVDHTLLSQAATWEEIKAILDDGIKYSCASCCIPASFVKKAKEYVGGKVAICTVIGFPNGYSTTETKCFETADAVKNGADEIDMVINIGKAKEGDFAYIEKEIKAVVSAAGGRTVKVILETCYLTDDEIVRACHAAKIAKANFVKTSTGFGTNGATVEHVRLMRETVGPDMGVKASGGVKNLADAEMMVEAGANRIGASSGVQIMKELEERGN